MKTHTHTHTMAVAKTWSFQAPKFVSECTPLWLYSVELGDYTLCCNLLRRRGRSLAYIQFRNLSPSVTLLLTAPRWFFCGNSCNICLVGHSVRCVVVRIRRIIVRVCSWPIFYWWPGMALFKTWAFLSILYLTVWIDIWQHGTTVTRCYIDCYWHISFSLLCFLRPELVLRSILIFLE